MTFYSGKRKRKKNTLKLLQCIHLVAKEIQLMLLIFTEHLKVLLKDLPP